MRVSATLLAILISAPGLAWHGPPHQKITRAAVLSLPEAMQQVWGDERPKLIEHYCMLPDIFRSYHNNNDERWKPLQVFCAKPDGKWIHNVTWERADDLASIEYAMNGIIAGIRKSNLEGAAKHAGVLAHLLEDSTCPAHALSPKDSGQILADLLLPPSGKEDIYIHGSIEEIAPEFDLGRRVPRSVGRTVSEAARNLLERTYQTVKKNRANLLDIVRAIYSSDETKLDQFRLEAERTGAELLADALYTALVLSGEAPATTIIGVKLMKADRGASIPDYSVAFPRDCTSCQLMDGSVYEGQNSRELYFHVRVPVDRPKLERVKVHAGGLKVGEVIVEKDRLSFSHTDDTVVFDLPVEPRQRSSTLELHTRLSWPGIALRVEHAFEDRRAGKYASGDWPATQAQAALNLEFGMREAIRTLGLDKDVVENKLGVIHLMGFDTNYPLGHVDFPPHVHMIHRWPHFSGSQAPHFYIDADGLLTDNVVTIDGFRGMRSTRFNRGETFTSVDYKAQPLYEATITPEGHLRIGRSRGGVCTLQPDGRGFHKGARLICDGAESLLVKAEDDTSKGELRVQVGNRAPEAYLYDVDTGDLLEAQEDRLDSKSIRSTDFHVEPDATPVLEARQSQQSGEHEQPVDFVENFRRRVAEVLLHGR